MSAYFVLWGKHPRYAGGEAIKLTGGSLRECQAAQRVREQDGGWKLAIYLQGTAPLGLRTLEDFPPLPYGHERRAYSSRLEWAVKNINAVPTGGPVLTINGKRPVFGPCAGKRCSCRVRPFSASQGVE